MVNALYICSANIALTIWWEKVILESDILDPALL